jgi:hypothetical protein
MTEVQERKSTILGRHLKYWDAGWGKIVSRFWGVINFVMILATYLAVSKASLSLPIYVLIGLVICSVIYVCGYLYTKSGMLKSEYSNQFVEWREMLEIRKNIEEIKVSIGELKK